MVITPEPEAPRAAPSPAVIRADVAVIGAGPAGLMAAEILATAGHRVTVHERMPSPGRKLLMAGRGGLNLTHSEPLEPFRARYGAGRDRIAAALAVFPPDALIRWANGLGQETFVGSSGRVFPKALKASPLLRAWLQRLEGLDVRLALRRTWMGFDHAGAPLMARADGTLESLKADAVVLAVGGASWPRLGSDGSWVAALRDSGTRVSTLRPANMGVVIPWSSQVRERCAGEPLKRIAVTALGRTVRGEAVMTGSGLEGGAIYAVAGVIRDALATGAPVTIHVDLRPDMTVAELTRKLSASRGKQSMATFLRKTVHLSPAAIAVLREPHAGRLSADPADLAAAIKAVPLSVTGTAGLERAISTAGGVAFDDLDEHLMLRSRPGVFAAGEMLDWDAPTGGYLLQACFATAVVAAHGAVRWLSTRARGQRNA